MYIIDETYFIKDLQVPNLSEMDSDNLAELETYIDKYVPELLQNLLGYDLFELLNSNLEPNRVDVKPTAPQKIKDLVNGKVYQVDGKNKKWKGLVYEEGLYKGSLLAKFVFYFWLMEKSSLVTTTGEKLIDSQNAINVNSTQRLVGVWNDFLKDYQGNKTVNYRRNTVFVSNFQNHACGSNYIQSDFVSLLQFLSDHKTDFPIDNLFLLKPQNQLGL